MPELGCPVAQSELLDEELKERILRDFGIDVADAVGGVGSENWPSVQIQIIYNALSKINSVLGGNLKSSYLGGNTVSFYKFKNALGDGQYAGIAHDKPMRINFSIVDVFPRHLIYHEMGHILNYAQGQRYTNSLESTAVYTDYPNREGERVMGGTPYNRIYGKGLISSSLQDPCGKFIDAELHTPDSFPGDPNNNTSGEEWGDLFANYIAGNFRIINDDVGLAKYNWVEDQLFGT
jgi:hypothetical protein